MNHCCSIFTSKALAGSASNLSPCDFIGGVFPIKANLSSNKSHILYLKLFHILVVHRVCMCVSTEQSDKSNALLICFCISVMSLSDLFCIIQRDIDHIIIYHRQNIICFALLKQCLIFNFDVWSVKIIWGMYMCYSEMVMILMSWIYFNRI